MPFNTLVDKISPFLLDEKYYPYDIPVLKTKDFGMPHNKLIDADTNKYMMYDFYVLDYLNYLIESMPPKQFRDLNPDMVDSVKDAVKKLFPHLRQELLDAVFYAICAEMRNTTSQMSGGLELFPKGSKERKMYYAWLKYMRSHRGNGSGDKSYSPEDLEIMGIDKPSSDVRTPELEKDNSKDRNLSYKAANYAIKQTGGTKQDFVDMATKMFFTGKWSPSYGGSAWGRIGKGWQSLNASDKLTPQSKQGSESEVKPMSVAIDHVYDLQHNTDTVFNKLKSYYSPKSGYSWIGNALDHKANVKSYHDLLKHTSGSIKSMALPVLYNRLGSSWDNQISIDTPVTKSGSADEKNAGNNARGKYKVGEYLQYIGKDSEGIGEGLTPGKTYQVSSADGNLIIGLTNDNGEHKQYFEYQFKPAPTTHKVQSLSDLFPEQPSEWKKGDRVECIDPGGYGMLTKGETYTLLKDVTNVSAGDTYITIDPKGNGVTGNFHTKRFKKVDKSQDIPQWPDEESNYKNAEIKKGDILKCIKPGHFKLTMGKHYMSISDENHSQITVIADDGQPLELHSGRFEMVSTAKGVDALSYKNVNVGDKVVCINNDGAQQLTVGKMYEVKDVQTNTLEIMDDWDDLGNYNYFRFKKAESQESAKGDALPNDSGKKLYTSQEMNKMEDLDQTNVAPDVKVVCISNSGLTSGLTIGKVYKIDNVGNSHVLVTNDNGSQGSYMFHRFKKLPEKHIDHSKWSHGDLLKCIDNKGGARKELNLGQVYVADGYPIPAKDEGFYIKIKTVEGQEVGTYKTTRFENVEREEEKSVKVPTKVAAKKVDKKMFDAKGKDIEDKYDFKIGDSVTHKHSDITGEITQFFNQNGTDGITVTWTDPDGHKETGNWAVSNVEKFQEPFVKGDKVLYDKKHEAIILDPKQTGSKSILIKYIHSGMTSYAPIELLSKVEGEKPKTKLADIFNKVSTEEDESEFKVGDIVYCVNAGIQPLTAWKKYKVLRVFHDNKTLTVLDDDGMKKPYMFARFKKADEEPKDFENKYGYKVGDIVKSKATGVKAKVIKFATHSSGEDGIMVELQGSGGGPGHWKAANVEPLKPEPKEDHKEFKIGDHVNSESGSHSGIVIGIGHDNIQVQMDGSTKPKLWLPKGKMHKKTGAELNAKYTIGDKVIYNSNEKVYEGIVNSIKNISPGILYSVYFKEMGESIDLKETDENLKKAPRPFKQKFDIFDAEDTPKFKVGDTVKAYSNTTKKTYYGTIEYVNLKDKDALVSIPYQSGDGSHGEWFSLDELEHDIKI